METTSICAKEITREWYLVDAEEQILGRLASRVAQLLRGKNQPYFTPHMDMGGFVVIINAGKVIVTGNKEKDKTYFWCACGLSQKQPFCDGSHKKDGKFKSLKYM
mgnify:CR=1 FL=1